MKNLISAINQKLKSIFFLTAITSIPVTAQIPDYFAGNPEWKMNAAYGANGDCVTEISYVLYVQGDTVIGPNTYKKMCTRGTYHYITILPPGCTSTDHFSDQPHSYPLVRQDSTRIWLYNSLGDELLYDFDLQVGDTLPTTILNPSDSIIVDSISTIMVDGNPRKVFHLVNGETTKLIEGVASINETNDGGFLVNFPLCFECLQTISCFALNDTVYYPGFQVACELNVGIETSIENPQIIIYPNPFINSITITGIGKETEIKLYNTLGEILGNWIISENNYTILTEDLPPGIYFINIGNTKKKIIKQ